ncbi:MAG TPA: MarR family transcriptional regulator [Spirochaetota bacterium]
MDKLNLSLSNLITKSARVIVRHYQREVAGFGITPSQAGVVYILSVVGPSTQVEIAKRLHLEKTNVNAMVRKLERSGFIRIEKHGDDARKSEVALTTKGKTLAGKLVAIDEKVGKIYLGMAGSAANAKVIRAFLEKIVFGGNDD